jgi:hypothetical protein
MNRLFHTLAWTLIGSYLMLPPAAQHNGIPRPNVNAPISQWTIAESFDNAKVCEAELDKHRKGFQHTYRKANHAGPGAQFWAQFYVAAADGASCIETDDPRLKADSPANPSNLQNSQAN